jgi:hypothetical protein
VSWLQTSRCDAGRIYNWVTEGFDTDMKDAKALLNELDG